MDKAYPILAVLFLFFVTQPTKAQQNKAQDLNLYFHSGITVALEENFEELGGRLPYEQEELVEGHLFRLVQFYEIPDRITRAIAERQGVEFLEYIPNHSYLASLPAGLDLMQLSGLGIRSIAALPPGIKIGPHLRNSTDDKVDVYLVLYKTVHKAIALNALEQNNITVVDPLGDADAVRIEIEQEQLAGLAAWPFVQFLEEVPPPGEPEDKLARNLHRVNLLDSEVPNGYNYTGEGVNLMVRDDGIVGPHIDYKGRLITFTGNDGASNHADGVAGVMGGAGNLNPDYPGSAPKSTMYILSYNASFTDNTLSLHQNDDVKITNSSYSDGCNRGYSSVARRVDEQVYQNPTLMHVFSAGNSGGSDCGYGAGDGWGNITGGHKVGKNVTTVGNLFSNGSLVNSSSRGPVDDGRIKPDICANGEGQINADPFNEYDAFGGTSSAAPSIAGIMGVLYEAYRDFNGGDDPESALVKACLLNTANDLGRKGPDFEFGWGVVNSYRALKILENKQYRSGSLDQDSVIVENITIDSNVRQIRVMLYWADPPSSIFSNTALVNNLDLQLENDSGMVFLPWVLNPFPHPDSLRKSARPGIDDLNNMEQVLVENIEPGNFKVVVRAKEVPTGPQKYYLVFDYVTDEIKVTYPNGGEGLEPFTNERIHWDAFGNQGSFQIEYSADSGATWATLATVSGGIRNFNWSVPGDITGKALIRVSRGDASDVSDHPFSVSNVPFNLAVEQVCPEYVRVSWAAVDGADGYDIFMLGDKFMDSVGTSPELFFDIPINTFPPEDLWFAVRARGQEGLRSQRSIAVNFQADGLVDCVVDLDLAVTGVNLPPDLNFVGCNAFTDSIEADVSNTGLTPLDSFELYYQLEDGPVISLLYTDTLFPGEEVSLLFSVPVNITSTGRYDLRIWLSKPEDNFAFNDTLDLNFRVRINSLGSASPPDFQEGFEGPFFPPIRWEVVNQDNGVTWDRLENVISADGTTGNVVSVNNFVYDEAGQYDVMNLPLIDLTDAEKPSLTFDYAHAYNGDPPYNGLRVEVLENCLGSNYVAVFDRSGPDLATIPIPLSFEFIPGFRSHWRSVEVDLSPYVGNYIAIKFSHVSGNGNNLYVDNINIIDEQASSTENIIEEQGDLIIFPNPATEVVYLRGDMLKEVRQIRISDMLGREIIRVRDNPLEGEAFPVDLKTLEKGVYLLSVYDDKDHFLRTFKVVRQ